MKYLFLLLLMVVSPIIFSQNTQTIRGKIIDGQSKYPLTGTSVLLLNSNKGNFSDDKGYFHIDNVALGRATLKISFIGYKTQIIPNIVVTSGKEPYIEIELIEEITELSSVIVKPADSSSRKRLINNQMVTVSAKTFFVDDTKRFAGSRNDPARMAANFAGVVGNNDARNDIVIRGNSPLGLLWLLEGIPIPNPNHYGSFGATGGPVSMLNNNVLAKSDFLTGAFPAMYNNATSGVFDLRLRDGNPKKREFVGQVGLNGFEVGAEGYLKEGKEGSFVINYRYSAVALLDKIGIKVNAGYGRAIPFYQDLNAKVSLPISEKTKLSFFTLIGRSNVSLKGADGDSTNFFSGFDRNVDYVSNATVVGTSLNYFFNKKTSLKFSLAYTTTQVQSIIDSLNIKENVFDPSYRRAATDQKIIFNATFTKKISAKKLFILGFYNQSINYSYIDSVRYVGAFNFMKVHNVENKKTSLLQAYCQYQYKPTERFTLNTGLSSQYFALNDIATIEPRVGIKYELKNQNSISFGLGLHSQLQNLEVYYLQTLAKNGAYTLSNTNLEFTKSFQSVLSYQHLIHNEWMFKTEIYYQHLYNIPVEQKPSYYSVLNEGTSYRPFEVDSLVNAGKGKNYGVEVTLEKYFSRGYYFLNTISVFDSKFQGSNGILKNTVYNGNYILNWLLGKEWSIKNKHTFSIDVRYTLAGGKRYTPLNETLSKQKFQAIFDVEKSYDLQYNQYNRFDIKIGYKLNQRKISHDIYLDIQNLFNTKNIFNQEFNKYTAQLSTQYQLGINPILNYRIQF